MGREIDERVVQMKFENGQFEKGISTSIRSMEELKKGMDFDDAVKGFNKLDEAAKGLKLTGLANGVEAVRVKFDLLQITAFNVLNRISNKAIDTGERMVKGLSIDQVAVGWDKFASKTTSVQTIMAATASQFSNTSEQMAMVNEQLDKLNWFTDETSYNFVDMVNNIGKFTSNNIDLETSVTAMQGIANWAAISGANANEASRAMYNLSQALSTGSVKLIDWKSIENANMATAEFKKTVIEMAAAEGTLKKVSEDTFTTLDGKVEISTKTFKGFNDSLQKGWFNTNVLMKSLDRYGGATNKLNKYYEETGLLTSEIVSGIDDYTEGVKTAEQVASDWGISLDKTQEILEDFNNEQDQFGLKAFKAAQEAKTFEDAINSVKDAVSTGWMKSFEYIFGDYLEAKEFFTDLANTLYDIFAAGGEERNAILKEWKQWGGRDYFIDSIWNALNLILAILKPIQAAWNNVFGEMSSVQLLNLTARLQRFMEMLASMAENNMPKLERTFNGLFAILDMIRMLLGGAFRIALSVIQEIFGELNVDVFEFTGSIGDSIMALRNWMREGRRFDNFVDDIIKLLKSAIASVRSFINAIKEFGPVKAVIDGFHNIFTEDFHGIESVIGLVSGVLGSFWDLIKTVPSMTSLEKVKESFKEFGASIGDTLSEVGFSIEGLGQLGDKIFGGLVTLLQSVGGGFKTASNQASNGIDLIKEALDRVDWAGVTIVASGIAILALAFKIADSVAVIAKSFGKVTDVMKSFKLMTDSISNYFKALKDNIQSNNILKIAAAVGILALAFYKLAQLDSNALWTASKALGVITVAIAALVYVTDRAGKKGGKGGDKAPYAFATTIISFAAAVALIAKALNDIEVENIGPRLLILAGVIVAMLGLTTYLSSGSAVKRSIPGIMSYVSMAAAIYMLIGALKLISALNAEDLFKALPIMAGLMLVMAACARLATRTVITSKSISSAGFKAGGAFNKNASGGKAVGGFGSIMAMAIAMVALVGVIKRLGEMDPETLLKGLVGLGAVMLEFGALMLASSIAGQHAKKAGQMMLYITIALNLLRPALKGLGEMDEATLVKGVAAVKQMIKMMGFIMVASKFAGENAAKAGLMFIGLAGALMAIQLVVKTLGKLDVATLTKGVIAVGALILAIGAMMKGAGGNFSMETTKSIVKLTVIIGLLGALLVGLTFLKPERVLASSASISAVLLSLGVSFKLINKIEAPSLKDMAKLYGAIALLGAAIGAIAYFTDPKSILATATGMSEVLIALGVSMRLMSGTKMPTEKQGQSWATMVSALGVIMMGLVVAVGIINAIPGGSVDGILKVTTGMSEILVSLALAGRIMDKTKNPSVNNTRAMNEWVLSVGVIMVALGLVVGAINSTGGSVNGVLKLTSGMSEIILSLALASRIMGKNGGDFKFDKKSLAMIGVLVAGIGGIVTLFSRWTNPDSVIPLATGMSVLLLALSASMKILSTINADTGKLAAAAGVTVILGVVIAGVGLVLAKLSTMTNPETVLPIAAGLSVVMLALAGVVAIIGRMPPTSLVGGIEAVLLMGAVVAAIAGVVYVLGHLMKSDDFRTILADGGEALGLLGVAIGSFVGGIIGGVANGITAALPMIGEHLSDFMDKAQGFFDGAANIPDNLLSAVSAVAGAMIILGGAELVSAIEGILTWALTLGGNAGGSMADRFEDFGKALSAFSNGLGKNFDAKKVEKAAAAGKALAELERSLPGQGGKLQEWIGRQDLGQFGSRLVLFGMYIRAFGMTVVDLKVDAVEAAANAGMLLSNLENSLVKQGGHLQSWIGEQDLGKFGARLVLFGTAIKAFSLTVAGVTAEGVEGAVAAGTLLSELENSLTLQGGFMQTMLGEKSLANFGDNLSDLGAGLVDFSDDAQDISVEAIKTATAAIAELITLESQVTTSGGWGELFTGKSDFSSFGENLRGLGEGLASLDNSISTIEIEDINDVILSLKDIIALGASPTSYFDGLTTLSNKLVAIGPSLKDWSETATNASTDSMKNVTKEIERLLRLSELTDASQWIADIVAYAGSMVYQLTTSLTQKHADLYKAGKDIAYWLIAGVKQGMRDEQPGANEAAANCADGIKTAFEKEAGIASPSTVMIEEGHWLVKGLAEGITSDMSAEDAAEKKAANIVSAFQGVLDQISLVAKNRQLKSEVWSVSEGLNATDAEKQQRDLQDKGEELNDAAEQVKVNSAAFEVAKQQFAEGSKQYIEAENRMLESLKSMYEIKNEIDQLQGTLLSSTGDSYTRNNDAYISYIKENEAAYKMMGWDQNKLIEDAKKKTGFGLGGADQYAGKINTQAIVDSALGQQQVQVVQEEVKKRTSSAARAGSQQGMAEGTAEGGEQGYSDGLAAVGDAILNGDTDTLVKKTGEAFSRTGRLTGYEGAASAVEGTVKGLADNSSVAAGAMTSFGNLLSDTLNNTLEINSPSHVTQRTGAGVVEGLVKGITDNIPSSTAAGKQLGTAAIAGLTQGINEAAPAAISAAQAVANRVAAIMRSALRVNSPSKVTMAIGNSVDEGLALGMRQDIGDVENASYDVTNAMAAALDDAKGKINDIVQSDEDFNPVITPVLNLDEINKQGSQIASSIGGRRTLDLSAARVKVGDIADQTVYGQNGSKAPTSQTNYNFTQNNYSPKALNRSEIYRHTNNQFSRLKGASQR